MAKGTITLNSNNGKLAGKIEWTSYSNGSVSNTSNVNADLYARRTDGYDTKGTWIGILNVGGEEFNFSNSAVSVGSNWVLMKRVGNKVVNHSNDGSGTCHISGYCNAPTGTSLAGAVVTGETDVTLDQIARYAILNASVRSKFINNIIIQWSTDVARNYTQYSINNGAWLDAKDVVANDNKSGYFTIENLKYNTSYSIKIRVRRSDSGLWTEKNLGSISTFDIARISILNNFNHGDNCNISVTNPANAIIKLRLIVGGITIFTRSISKGNNLINFNDQELDNIYKKYGSNNNVTATFIVDTYNGSNVGWSNSKNVTIYLKGNQKSIKDNVNGWKRGKIWININGWKRGVVWIKVNGSWKRGI